MPPAHPEDLELVRRYLGGDRSAGDRLAARLACVGRILRARSRSLLGGMNDEDLLDCGQSVLTRMFARLSDYEGRAALESWAFAFCEGELRNAWRRQQRERPAAGIAPDDVASGRIAPEDEFFDDLLACLDRLGRDDRRLVQAKHFEGLTLDDIAGRVAQKLNTVKSRYYRALLQLRKCLQRRAGIGEA